MSTTELSETLEDFTDESGSVCSDFELSALESDERSVTSNEAQDSDLEDLYESFDYEDDTSTTEDRCTGMIMVDCSVTSTPIYPGTELTVFQSYLLLFQYAVCHPLRHLQNYSSSFLCMSQREPLYQGQCTGSSTFSSRPFPKQSQ